MIKVTKTFTGSMDHDSEDHLIAPEDYRILFAGENDARIKRGVVKNIKDDVLVNNAFLQNGDNTVIGSKEDITNGSCIYCVYNSNGFHSIFQYFRNRQGYATGRIEKLVQPQNPQLYNTFNENPLNFSNLQPYMVTGINLVDRYLSITDNRSRSKVIDIVRANETGKRRRFNIIFNAVNFNPYVSPSTYTLDVYQQGNPVPVASLTWLGTGTTYADRVKEFVTAFRNSGLSSFGVIACGEHAVVEMVQEGAYYVHLSEVHINVTDASLAVPENFYPDKDASLPVSFDIMSRDLFDELCYTPNQPPRVSYGTDTTRIINLVKNRLFQFAFRYQYLDYSWGVFGSRSKIALPQRSCNDENNYGNANNYITVDFTDPRLANPALVSIILKGELIVNEPAVDEVWRSVKVFEQHEIAGLQAAKFKFYNDGNYAAVAATVIVKDKDDLFVKFKSKEFVGNRQFAAGGVEGYDGPCLDAKINTTYAAPQAISGRYSVAATAVIQNVYYVGGTSTGDHFSNQPVWKYSGATFYGGWRRGVDPSGGNIARPGDPGSYQQTLPSGGFPFYLAATNYYGITKQIFTAAQQNLLTSLGLTTDPVTGAIIIQSITSADAVKLYTFLDYCDANQVNIQQQATIPNVPNGRYVLRMASQKTTPLQLAGSAPDYRRSSAVVSQYINGVPMQGIYENEFVVNGANIPLGALNNFVVGDVCDKNGGTGVQMGYVVANDITAFSGTLQEYINETRVDRAKVITGDPLGHTSVHHDHNGFFWVAQYSVPLNITTFYSGQLTIGINSSIDDSGAPWTAVNAGQGKIGYFRTTDATLKDTGRTFLDGQVINSTTGFPQQNVSVVNTRGQVGVTGSQGFFSIPCYPETVTIGGSHDRDDAVIFCAFESLCQFSFPIDKVAYSITIDASDYNDNPPAPDHYPVPTIYCTVLIFSQAYNYFKRGGDFKFALKYMDEGDRYALVTNDQLQKHILFYTEKDENGVLQLRGNPILDWTINHPPPDWAVKYQWVVTTNLQLSTYLQWCANKIDYVDSDDNVTTPTSAAFVRINLDNIGYYTVNMHPDAVIKYDFVKGDRLRLIADPNGVPYTDYYDFEILKNLGTTVYIYPLSNLDALSAGLFFEMYTPKGKDANNLFFEFGECFEIKEGVFSGVRKKYHAGPVQNQSFGPMPFQTVTPAKGIFTGGDVYYRLRSIPINTPPSGVGSFTEKLLSVDDRAASDFYASSAPGYGRVSVDSPEIGQVISNDVIRLSNLYIPGVKSNGFRNYDAANRKQLSSDYGLISKLQVNGNNVLNAFCENSATLSMYIDKSVLRQAVDSPIVAIADAVINNAEKYQRSFGTVNPESVQVNDQSDAFGWDENKSVVLRSSGNGLIPVSDYKLISTFNEIGRKRNALKYKNSKVVGTYNVDRDIYILSFNSLQPFAGEKPFVRFPVPQLETGGAVSYPIIPMLKLTVMPLNIDLVSSNATDADFPDTGKIILNNVNAGTVIHGWTASLDDDGFVTLTAPDASDVYSNNEIVLRINYLFSAAASFKQYTYNLSQAVLPSAETEGYEGETYVFCKDKNGWIQKYPFVPEYYGRIKGEILKFKDGQLWLHEGGSGYGSSFGTYFNRRVDFIFTGDRDVLTTKQFTSVEVNAKAIHFCPEITTPSNELFPNGMRTQLRKINFALKQGKFYADILRDETTPGFANPNLAILDGRRMLGQNIKFRLENDSITEAELLECQLQYIHSEYS